MDFPVIKNLPARFFPGGPMQGARGSIAGQGTRSHLPQLKIPWAATKTQQSQINEYFKNIIAKYTSFIYKQLFLGQKHSSLIITKLIT